MTSTSSWLDKAFFETLLREAEGDAKLQVIDVDVQPGVGKGENFVSVMHRCVVTVSKNGSCSERYLMVKTLPETEAMLAYVKEGGIFERETYIYTHIIPAFRRLQESSGVAVTPLGCRSFKTNRPHTVVMEDLSRSGYHVAQRQLGLDLTHCRVVIEALARFHALSLGLLQRDPTVFDVYPDKTFSAENREQCHHYQDANLETLACTVETWPGYERFGDKLRNSNFLDKVIDLMQVPNKFSVLTHGDCWSNNVMFKHSKAGDKPDDIIFIDFQLCRVVSLAFDIQYLLHTSAQNEVRMCHWDTLLAAYHAEFVVTAASVGVTGPLFSLDELRAEVADKAAFGLLTVCWVLSVVLADPEDAPDMSDMPVFEPGAESKAPASGMARTYSGARFKEAMKMLLPEFEKQGVL